MAGMRIFAMPWMRATVDAARASSYLIGGRDYVATRV